MAGSQRHACELAHQIRLFGGERGATIDRHGILAVLLLEFAEPACCEIQSLVPLRGAESLRRSHKRIEKPVGGAALHIAFDTFGTEHAAVERKLLPWLKSRHAIVADFELNSALLAAEAAMRLYKLLAGFVRLTLPTARRSVIQVRTESAFQFVLGTRQFSHANPPSS